MACAGPTASRKSHKRKPDVLPDLDLYMGLAGERNGRMRRCWFEVVPMSHEREPSSKDPCMACKFGGPSGCIKVHVSGSCAVGPM